MGCGCRKQASLTGDSRGLTQTYPAPDDTGTIMLASDEECSGPYRGPLRNADVLIVGIDSEHEALFVAGEHKKALEHAHNHGLRTLDRVKAGKLCAETVKRLLDF